VRDVPVVFVTAGRNGALWAAIVVSDRQGQLAQLVTPRS